MSGNGWPVAGSVPLRGSWHRFRNVLQSRNTPGCQPDPPGGGGGGGGGLVPENPELPPPQAAVSANSATKHGCRMRIGRIRSTFHILLPRFPRTDPGKVTIDWGILRTTRRFFDDGEHLFEKIGELAMSSPLRRRGDAPAESACTARSVLKGDRKFNQNIGFGS